LKLLEVLLFQIWRHVLRCVRNKLHVFNKLRVQKTFSYIARFIKFDGIIVSLIFAKALEITQEHVLDMIVLIILLNIN